MARRRKPSPAPAPAPTDPVVLSCLSAVKAGDMAAAAALADRLEEIGDPLAPRIRELVQRWEANLRYFQQHELSARHKRTTWEAIATWHRWLRVEIRVAWGRRWKWRKLTLKQLDDANAAMSVSHSEE